MPDDRPTFADAPMRAAAAPPAPSQWHVFVTVRLEDAHQVEIEYVCEAKEVLGAFRKAIEDVAAANQGENYEVVALTGKLLPATIR